MPTAIAGQLVEVGRPVSAREVHGSRARAARRGADRRASAHLAAHLAVVADRDARPWRSRCRCASSSIRPRGRAGARREAAASRALVHDRPAGRQLDAPVVVRRRHRWQLEADLEPLAGAARATTSPHSTTRDRVVVDELVEAEVDGAPAQRSRRYTSTCSERDAALRTRARCVNVGLTTGSSTPRPSASPCANTVLPAPRSPGEQRRTSPARARRRRSPRPSACVSVGRVRRPGAVSRSAASRPGERPLDHARSRRAPARARRRRCAAPRPGAASGPAPRAVAERELLAAQLRDARPSCRAAASWRSCRASRRRAAR